MLTEDIIRCMQYINSWQILWKVLQIQVQAVRRQQTDMLQTCQESFLSVCSANQNAASTFVPIQSILSALLLLGILFQSDCIPTDLLSLLSTISSTYFFVLFLFGLSIFLFSFYFFSYSNIISQANVCRNKLQAVVPSLSAKEKAENSSLSLSLSLPHPYKMQDYTSSNVRFDDREVSEFVSLTVKNLRRRMKDEVKTFRHDSPLKITAVRMALWRQTICD